MNKKIGILGLSLTFMLALASCGNPTTTKDETSSVSSSEKVIDYNPVVKNNIYTGNYYDSINTIDSNSLKLELNKIINNGFMHISYGEATEALKTIDSYDNHYVECLYSGMRMDPQNSGSSHGQWNKEHIWAKTYGFNATSYNAYSDVQMLRVTESGINGSRGDKYFNNVDGTSEFGNSWNDSEFEPRDEVKGDVARIMFYMTVMYDSDSLDLELTDDVSLINASKAQLGGTAYLGKLSVLLDWAKNDPVDEREIVRNNAAFNIQKNRNPFIDHPEYAYYIFKNECDKLNIRASDFANTYKAKNDDAIQYVDSRILSIGEVTLEKEQLINDVRADYNKLDEVSKSFVANYETLEKCQYRLIVLKDLANRDTTVGTTIDFTNVLSTSGSIASNGIKNDYVSPLFNSGKGIYAQTGKAITIKASNLYNTIKSVTIYISGNNNQTSIISISDGTNNVKETVNSLSKNEKKVELSLTGFDLAKDLMITITNENGKSVIVSKISYNI